MNPLSSRDLPPRRATLSSAIHSSHTVPEFPRTEKYKLSRILYAPLRSASRSNTRNAQSLRALQPVRDEFRARWRGVRHPAIAIESSAKKVARTFPASFAHSLEGLRDFIQTACPPRSIRDCSRAHPALRGSGTDIAAASALAARCCNLARWKDDRIQLSR